MTNHGCLALTVWLGATLTEQAVKHLGCCFNGRYEGGY